MGRQIEITDEQEKVVQLIKTWRLKEVKLALLMDDTQGLGVQGLYTGFVMKYGHLFHDQDPSPEDLAFPVHSLLFHDFTLRHHVHVPIMVCTRDELDSFLIDYNTLIGLNPNKNNEVALSWFQFYYQVNVSAIEEELKNAFFKNTGIKINFKLSSLPF